MPGSNICQETGTKIAGAQLKHYNKIGTEQICIAKVYKVFGLRGDTLTRLIVWCKDHCLFRNYEYLSLKVVPTLANSADTDYMLHSAFYKRLIGSQISFNY